MGSLAPAALVAPQVTLPASSQAGALLLDKAHMATSSQAQQPLSQITLNRQGDAADLDALLVQANALLARADTAYTTEWDVQEQASLDATLGRYPADRHPPLERYVRAAAGLPKK